MSLQDLFKKQNTNSKVVSADNATSSAEYVESVATIKRREELNDQFVPRLDYATASNFAKFGSAELYYEFAFSRIYNEYPYDGTDQEKLEFRLSSSYLDDYIFENHYPRTNGHVIFSAVNNSITAIHDGYGKPSTPEYISTKGGPHTGSAAFANQSIYKAFSGSNYYNAADDLGSSLELNFDPGVTIEFWLKKEAFDIDATEKEVIFDLWNNQISSSADYGRLTIALTSSTTAGANPFLITAQSGTTGFSEYQPTITNFTTASIADGNWHHYALTIASQSAGIQTKIYVDGVKLATDSNGSVGINSVSTINGNISLLGGLVTAPSASYLAHVTGSGKLSGSMDEFRYWKQPRTDKQVANTFFIPIGGGTNEFDYNRSLGLYYKFNEGITGTDSIDNQVLDYSGRIANGAWNNYTSSARQTTSAMVQSGYARSEFKDPIIYSFHPDVVSTLATLKTTGSVQDNEGTSKMMALLPGWLQEKDQDNYNNQVKKFTQIMASYFDNLNAQIGEVNNIFDEKYPTTTEEPYPFAQKLLESRGFVVPNLFTDGDLVNYLLQKDDNEIFEMNITDVKNRIYHNIYNNLTYILKSKGTEKSFRNLLRCFGIDSEVMRLSLYADDSTYTILDNYEYTSVEKKALNLNNRYNLEATIYNTASAGSSFTYISSSEGDTEQYTSFTAECEALFPLQLEKFDDGYFPKQFYTASIFGLHRALTSSVADYTWHPDLDTDLKVYAVKPEQESKDVYFVATSSYGGFNLTSSTFFNTYENNKWNFAFRIKNNKYPYTYGLTGSTGDSYYVEFVGYNSEGDTTKNSFSVSASVSNTIGKKFLDSSKRLYAGAHKTNFTGSTLLKSDVLITDVKYWQSYLDDETIQYHSFNPDNAGTKTPFRPDNVNTGIEYHELTDYETLALHWRFDTLTGSDASGIITGFDFSSGSTENASRNSWLGGITGRKYPFKGQNFITSSAKAIDKQFLYSAKQRNFGVLMSSDGVTIKNDANTLLFTDDDVSDNFYSFEKSYHGVISQEMLNMFASLIEFNDLIGYPIDGYKRSYKEMEKLARLFFEKMENRVEPEKFFDFYKWIDSSIMYALGQLFPASAKFSETSRNVVESHVLERNKLDRKFPILIDVSATEGYARGINELFYNWKFGHAPLATKATGLISLGGTTPAEDETITISDGVTSVVFTFKNTPSANNEVELDGAVTYENLITAINNYPSFNIIATDEGSPTLSLLNNTPGTIGNVTITETMANASNTVSGMTGGSNREDKNCLWQKHRKERTDITDRQTLLDNLNSGNNSKHLAKFEQDGTAYAGSTYALRNFGSLHKFSVVMDKNIHGGTNYGQNKNRDILWDATHIHGPVSQQYPKGIPQNTLVVGLGEGQGTEAFIDCVDVENPNEKRKWRFTTVAGRKASVNLTTTTARTSNDDYTAIVKGEIAWPTNVISASVSTGYQADVATKFKQGAVITNIHSDTYGAENDIGMQGPFTEAWVGGHQSRHIEINKYDPTLTTEGGAATNNNLGDQYSRPEGWRLLLRECPDVNQASTGTSQSGSNDGAMGFVGPDYGGPYPDFNRQYAIHYREERAKRPVNVRNIRTTTGSARAGNFLKNYEVVIVAGKEGNNLAFRKIDLANRQKDQILPDPIWNQVPFTTNYQTLIGYLPGYYGNVWGDARCFDPDFETKRVSNIGNQIFYENNRQVEEASSRIAHGSFYMSGAIYTGTKASGSFRAAALNNFMFNQASDSDDKFVTFGGSNYRLDIINPPTSNSDPNYYVQTGSNNTDYFNNLRSAINSKGDFVSSYTIVEPIAQTLDFSSSLNIQTASANRFLGGATSSLNNIEEVFSYWIDLSGSNYSGSANTGQRKYLLNMSDNSFRLSKELYISSSGDLNFNLGFGTKGRQYKVANFFETYKNSGFINITINNQYPNSAPVDNNTVIYINAVSQSVAISTSGGIISNSRTERNESEGRVDLFNSGSNYLFQGKAASVAFMNSVLNSTQIKQIYNNGYLTRVDKNSSIDSADIVQQYLAQSVYLGNSENYAEINNGTIWSGSIGDGQPYFTWTTAANTEQDHMFISPVGPAEPIYGFFSITSSQRLASWNGTIVPQNGTTYTYFTKIEDLAGATDPTGSVDADTLTFGLNSEATTFELDSNGSTSGDNIPVLINLASDTLVYNAMSASIKANTSFDTVNITSFGNYALLEITASGGGSGNNGTFTYTPSTGERTSFFSLSNPGGGLDAVTYYNIIERNRDDLTSSDSIITTRFSAPGGPEIQSQGYLDVRNTELSAYNAMPFRNLTVRSSGSGESGRIRLNDLHDQRFGLQTHLRRHSGQFGYDSVVGSETTEENYVTVPSFHKIQRNTAKRYVSGASAPVVDTIYNNGFYQSCIPQSDFQYAWVTGSIGEDLTQRILGFAPAGGFVSSSSGYVDAIVFPSASQILGSL